MEVRYDRVLRGVGRYDAYVPERRFWLPVVMSAISVGSQLFGAAKSAEKEQEARKREDAYSARREALARRQMNEEDTRAGRRLVRQAQESGDKLVRRAQGSAAMTGSLNEVAQAKEMANQNEANAREQASIMAERRQERGEAQMDAVLGQRSQQEASRLRAEGQNTAAVAGALANAAGAIASADFGGAAAKATGLSSSEKAEVNKAWSHDIKGWQETKNEILTGDSGHDYNSDLDNFLKKRV